MALTPQKPTVLPTVAPLPVTKPVAVPTVPTGTSPTTPTLPATSPTTAALGAPPPPTGGPTSTLTNAQHPVAGTPTVPYQPPTPQLGSTTPYGSTQPLSDPTYTNTNATPVPTGPTPYQDPHLPIQSGGTLTTSQPGPTTPTASPGPTLTPKTPTTIPTSTATTTPTLTPKTPTTVPTTPVSAPASNPPVLLPPSTTTGAPPTIPSTALSSLGNAIFQGPIPLPGGTSPTPVANTSQFTGTPFSGPSPSSIGSLQSYLQGGPNIDRVGIAKDLLAQFDPLTDAQFKGDLRNATLGAAARGNLGSGNYRTSLGDIVANRAQQRDAYARQLMDAAQTGSIDDFYKNVGIAQQQQGFAAGQQQTAFGQSLAQRQQDLQEKVQSGQMSLAQAQQTQNAINSDREYALSAAGQQLQQKVASGQLTMQQAQLELARQAQEFGQAVTQTQLQDYLTNSQFNRDATTFQLGNTNNPTSLQQWLAGLYGGQAGQAGTAASNLISQYLLAQSLQGQGGGGGAGGIDLNTLWRMIQGAGGGAAPTGTRVDGTTYPDGAPTTDAYGRQLA